MAEKKARLVFLNVDYRDPSLGTASGTPNWQRIAQMTSVTRSRSTKTADTTHFDDDGWESSIPVGKNWSFSAELTLDPDDRVYQWLERKIDSEEMIFIMFDLTRIGGGRKEGQVIIESIEDTFSVEDAAKSSISFKGTKKLAAI